MRYLLSIALGPVQEFIASARRSRDLWFGSWLLSELSKAAAKEIGQANLIFPSIQNPSDLDANSKFNVVNKILAVVDDDVAGLCSKRIRKAIEERLRAIRDEAFKKLPNDLTKFRQDVAEKQLEDLVEFYWAAFEFKNEDEYANARNEVEKLLAARKGTRDFASVSWHFDSKVAHAPKSSLDGQRESAIVDDVYDSLSKEELFKEFGVRSGERLCGVGLLKRHGNPGGDDSFFSTSHIASLPLLKKLTNSQAVNDYIQKLRQYGLKNGLNQIPLYLYPNQQAHPAFGRYDGHLLFEERLNDYIDTSTPQEKDNLKRAKVALRDFLKTALDNQKPSPYYALLLADGDRMGKAIDNESKKGIARHKELSENLSTFVKEVRSIVPSHEGCLVYAGGDDVLAFLPLHTVIACARELANQFKVKMKGFQDEDGNHPTLSVGVVVAHHLDPLSDTLELARQAEKKAKSIPGKNALALTVSKRSGADFTVKGHWGDIDNRLQWFTCLHLDEAISFSAAYELRELARNFKTMPDEIRDDATRVEAMRILKRKRAKDEKIKEDILRRLEGYITKEATLEDVTNEIIAARTFAKAMKQAGITATELKKTIEEKEAASE